MRINALLRADSSVTPDAMRALSDRPGDGARGSVRARVIAAAAAFRTSGRADPTLDTAARLLAEWDRRYTKDNQRAVLFESMMSALQDLVWDELARPPRAVVRQERRRGVRTRTSPPRVDTPADQLLVILLRDPSSPWWDVRATRQVVERRDDVLVAAMRDGYHRAHERYGDPAAGLRWDAYTTRIFSICCGSSRCRGSTYRARRPLDLEPLVGEGRFGASWRMVVELGPDVRPGPSIPCAVGKHRVHSFAIAWSAVAGELDPALFPRTEADSPRTASPLD